jgi:hypothetical protein
MQRRSIIGATVVSRPVVAKHRVPHVRHVPLLRAVGAPLLLAAVVLRHRAAATIAAAVTTAICSAGCTSAAIRAAIAAAAANRAAVAVLPRVAVAVVVADCVNL